MEFRCRLVTAAGEIVEGTYAAENEARLRHDFETQGLHVLSLRKRTALTGGSFLPKRRKISHHEFLVFNQEFATLLKAGMPLVQSIDLLRQQVVNPVFRGVLDDVHEKVRGGMALSDAFGDHGDLFPRVYTASLLAGERSGNLDAILRRYVVYEKVIDTVRRKTISALIYPVILIVAGGRAGRHHRAAGRAGVHRFLRELRRRAAAVDAHHSGRLEHRAGAVRPAGDGDRRAGERGVRRLDSAAGAARAVRSRWCWRFRSSARPSRKFTTAQMARTLATLLGGGIPLVNSLEVTARSVSNRHMANELDVVTQRVREGQGLAASLAARAVVPDVALKMIEVGESTGSLQDMLSSLADFYDEEVETSVGRFVTLIEPALLVVMGVVIAALVLALYMPLFELSNVVNQ